MNETDLDNCLKSFRKKYSKQDDFTKYKKSFHEFFVVNANYHYEAGNVFRSIGWGLLEVLTR